MSSTIRQKVAVQKLSENIRNSGGKKSIAIGKILRDSGYSKQTSLKPKLVTETKGFKDELSRIMPDEMIVKRHGDLVSAVKLNTIEFNNCLTDIEIKKIIEQPAGFKVGKIVRQNKNSKVVCYYWSPDNATRLVAINMGYKVKNLYQTIEQQVASTPIIIHRVSYEGLKSNPDLERTISK